MDGLDLSKRDVPMRIMELLDHMPGLGSGHCNEGIFP